MMINKKKDFMNKYKKLNCIHKYSLICLKCYGQNKIMLMKLIMLFIIWIKQDKIKKIKLAYK